MMGDSEPYSLENEVFRALLFYGGVILLKMLVLSPLTIIYRFATDSFMNQEDVVPLVGKPDPERQKRALVPNERVNRIKRTHLNDLENVVPFLVIALMYVATSPAASTAKLLFQAFTLARITHSFVYLFAVPQPSRFLAFLVAWLINVYMAVNVICSFC